MIDSSPGDDGGFKSITLDVKGDMVYSKMKWEAGVHRVQRVPGKYSITIYPIRFRDVLISKHYAYIFLVCFGLLFYYTS
jgi:hypothetical protein